MCARGGGGDVHTCAPPLLTSLAAMTRLSVLSLFIALGRLSKHMMQCLRQYPGNSISLAWIPDFQHDKEGEVLWPRVSQNGRFSVELERACGECWKYRDVTLHTIWEIPIKLIPEGEGHINRMSTPSRSKNGASAIKKREKKKKTTNSKEE